MKLRLTMRRQRPDQDFLKPRKMQEWAGIRKGNPGGCSHCVHLKVSLGVL
jgi:hypothetical protein